MGPSARHRIALSDLSIELHQMMLTMTLSHVSKATAARAGLLTVCVTKIQYIDSTPYLSTQAGRNTTTDDGLEKVSWDDS